MVAEWAATPDPSPGNPCASAVDNRTTRLVPATFAATPSMDQEPRELSGSRSPLWVELERDDCVTVTFLRRLPRVQSRRPRLACGQRPGPGGNDRVPADPTRLDPHTDWMRITHYSTDQPDLNRALLASQRKGQLDNRFGHGDDRLVHPHWL